jgi:phosphoglycerate dehydrogenase-like enzyme
LFAHAPHLKWIQFIFAGVEKLVSHVPANLTLTNASGVWTTKNLVVIPHCGIDDADHYVPALLDIFFDNISRYLNGQPLRNTVDLTQGY